MAKTKQKPKLSPIPAYKPGKARGRATRKVAAATPNVAAPDLSHILESLRPLAFPTADLAFMVGNPLSHPEEQVEDLKASLRQFGQVEALVVNKRQTPPVVLGGNGRLQAMLGLGWTHAAVAFVDLPERRANALATVLNRSREGAKWDKDNLDKLMRDMDTGNDEQLDAMMAALATEVGIVEKEASGVSQPARQQGESFQVIVECDTVESQTELHERLKGEGYKCKSLQT